MRFESASTHVATLYDDDSITRAGERVSDHTQHTEICIIFVRIDTGASGVGRLDHVH